MLNNKPSDAYLPSDDSNDKKKPSTNNQLEILDPSWLKKSVTDIPPVVDIVNVWIFLKELSTLIEFVAGQGTKSCLINVGHCIGLIQ